MNLLLAVATVLSGFFGAHDRDAACLTLGGLDSVRAQAYALKRPDLLQRVYVSAHAASTDRAVLRDYRRRGLRITGATMHRMSCEVADRAPGRLELDVVDHLGPATVSDDRGRTWNLPRDGGSSHRITLVRTRFGWRIEAVREQYQISS